MILLLALAILLKKPFSKRAMGVMELLLVVVLAIAVAHYRGPKNVTR